MSQIPNLNQYIFPRLTLKNIDLFFIRTSILTALKKAIPNFSGTLLDVGCGYMPYKDLILENSSQVTSYIGLDLVDNKYRSPDLKWDGVTIPLEDNSIDCAIATEVFEHCPDINQTLTEIFRVLKPNGMLFFTVPFLWPLHDVPYDEYRYTPYSLKRHLEKANFRKIEIEAMGGWDAALAQMIGLWIKRRLVFSKGQRLIRILLVIFCFPLIYLLIKLDTPPTNFDKPTMITGLSGIAIKIV